MSSPSPIDPLGLFSGAAGSGKTSTLYALMRKMVLYPGWVQGDPEPDLGLGSRDLTASEQEELFSDLPSPLAGPALWKLIHLSRHRSITEESSLRLLEIDHPGITQGLCGNHYLTLRAFRRILEATVLTGECDDDCRTAALTATEPDDMPVPTFSGVLDNPLVGQLSIREQVTLVSVPCLGIRAGLTSHPGLDAEALHALLEHDQAFLDHSIAVHPSLSEVDQLALLERGGLRLTRLAERTPLHLSLARALVATGDPDVLAVMSENEYAPLLDELPLPTRSRVRLDEVTRYFEELGLDRSALAALQPSWSASIGELVAAVRSFSA